MITDTAVSVTLKKYSDMLLYIWASFTSND